MYSNINQLVDRLKDVPDNALFGYVQDPKLQVPSVLALAEISRRQQIRAANASQPQMQGPQPTVADQVISANQGIGALPQAQQMPQAPMQMAQAPQMLDQGMASLPLPDDMYSEESYANGGIVAFDEGGDATEKRKKQAEEDRRRLKRLGYDTLRLPGGIGDIFGGSYNLLATGADKVANTLGIPRAGRALGIYEPEVESVALPKVGSGGPTPAQDYISGKVDELYNPQAPVQPKPQPQQKPFYPYADPRMAADANAANATVAATETADASTNVPERKREDVAAPNVGGLDFSGIRNTLRDVTVPTAPQLDRAGYVGEQPTMSGIQSLRKQAYKEAGVSEELYDDMRKDIKSRLSDLPKEREDAVAHAMIMAGLGIAGGTSQFALQNIAQGAAPAMKGFREDVKELNAKKDKLAERNFAVMEAQNKFRQTGADSDLKELNSRETERRGAERDFTKFQTQTQERYDDKTFQLNTEIAKADLDIAKTKLDARLKAQQLSISSFDAETRRLANQKPELFATIMSNLESDPKYINGDSKTKRDMIAEAVLATSPKVAGAGLNDNTLRTKALDITSKYFESGGAGHLKYKALLKTDPAAAQKMYTDYFNQQLGLAKSTLGAASSGNVVDFNSLP
jgi:hypothetical protein